ncbi:PQQ-binding-like beta-propeller repeat protein [Yinghuangia seranimata]|uniref:outer membrane protein assembly factor BamB family protein n=1 Tax=Yinghuangia seranimata TaxID=408067 RepID=UPI00248AF257|nr:PQQ-binding-like beta-propeller repeat protein [Yinghuangia seranimata]MDI2130579.1 PQQ-binding-like beta-propeller repeat protein [Yinghuangia seranimata]
MARRTALRGTRALIAAAAVLLAAGCTSPGKAPAPPAGSAPSAAGPGAGASAPPSRKAYDPPVAFQAAGPVMPPGTSGGQVNGQGDAYGPFPVLLYGTTAYIAGADRMDVVDTGTGRTTATVRPQRPPFLYQDQFAGNNTIRPPVLVSAADRPTVLVPFTVAVPGQGTTPGHDAVELHAVDTATGATVWVAVIDLPRTTPVEYTRMATAYREFATVIGSYGTTVVLGDGRSGVYALNILSQQVLWHRDGLRTPVVAGPVVVGDVPAAAGGGAPYRLLGLDLETGTERWASRDVGDHQVFYAGPTRIAALVRPDRGSRYFTLVDTATGALVPVANPPQNATQPRMDCQYDRAAVLVCHEALSSGWSFALDPISGAVLWEIPGGMGSRLSPRITTVWHGMVYGRTENGPVVLDARTGADRNTAPGVAPYAVNEYVGIAQIPDRYGLFACPATG